SGAAGAGAGTAAGPGHRALGPMAELEHTGPVGPEVITRLLCDASVARVVLAGGSEPLDVGRRTWVVPAPMRRAVVARDRHCRFPGCGRPPAWCEAHHVVPWEDGGPTAVANLLLLCRSHHRLVHRRRRPFGLKMVEGRPVFCRPDGTVLEERAPP
ncbi:MAG: HNH endonuclease, partial [Actinomycetota bacterium]|nr:HNH endonuclease [Actinomycetota bacterium]